MLLPCNAPLARSVTQPTCCIHGRPGTRAGLQEAREAVVHDAAILFDFLLLRTHLPVTVDHHD